MGLGPGLGPGLGAELLQHARTVKWPQLLKCLLNALKVVIFLFKGANFMLNQFVVKINALYYYGCLDFNRVVRVAACCLFACCAINVAIWGKDFEKIRHVSRHGWAAAAAASSRKSWRRF